MPQLINVSENKLQSGGFLQIASRGILMDSREYSKMFSPVWFCHFDSEVKEIDLLTQYNSFSIKTMLVVYLFVFYFIY